MIVYLDLEKPILLISPSNAPREGDSVMLACTVKGTSPIRIKWYHGKTQIPGSSKIYVINNIQRNENGNYYCELENTFEKIESEKKIITVKCEFLFICSKLTIKTIEQGVKYVQS